MVVVDSLDEWLDFTALLLPSFGHAACDLLRVAFNAGHKSMRKGMRFGSAIYRLYYDHLFASSVCRFLLIFRSG